MLDVSNFRRMENSKNLHVVSMDAKPVLIFEAKCSSTSVAEYLYEKFKQSILLKFRHVRKKLKLKFDGSL